jgi:hypothetical protein
MIVDYCLQYDEHLTQLESKISLVQERALEQAETDSLGTWHLDEEQEHPQVQPSCLTKCFCLLVLFSVKLFTYHYAF